MSAINNSANMDAGKAHGVKSRNKVGVSTNPKRDGIMYTYVLSCCAATVSESGMSATNDFSSAGFLQTYTVLFTLMDCYLSLSATDSVSLSQSVTYLKAHVVSGLGSKPGPPGHVFTPPKL